MEATPRLFGLDLLRAAAVILVVLVHSLKFTHAPNWLCSYAWVGELGVGSLLVLSGYLIGWGLIKKCQEGRFSRIQNLTSFYARRWSRTFPAYFFYLAMMAALFPPFLPQLLAHKEYFFFLQNFAWNQADFYGQSWTLALLEFFYLLFPLLLMFTNVFVQNHRLSFAVSMGVLFFIPLVLRAMHTQIETPAEFENSFRKWVIYRLDSPMVGVAAALLQAELPGIWTWFVRRSWLGLVIFSALPVYYQLGCPYLYASHWLQVFFFPISAFATVFILPLLCSWKSDVSPFGTVIKLISQTSYSLYCSHLFSLSIGFCLLAVLGIPVEDWLIACPLYIVLVALVVWPSYYLMEKPFIQIRDSNPPGLWIAVGKFWRQLMTMLFPNPIPLREEVERPRQKSSSS